MTDQTLSVRTAEKFTLFWNKTEMASKGGVNEPELPRKRKTLKRLESGAGEGDFSTKFL